MKSIAIRLKSGEHYNFSNVKEVKIVDNDYIEILGSIKHPNPIIRTKSYKAGVGKAKIVKMRKKMIANPREFTKFLREKFKYFDFDGVCPTCKSADIQDSGVRSYKKRINKWKEDIVYSDFVRNGQYFCLHCKKDFKELDPCDIVVYY